MMKPTVYVVDDDPAMRTAIERLVQSVGLDVVTFANADEFLDRGTHYGSGCLVLDVRLPGLSGLDLQQRLAEDVLPIVFITGHGSIPMSVRAMQAGAVDFLEKPFDEQELLDAIHKAIDKGDRERQARDERAAVEQCVMKLTHRERDVFARVVTGVPNKQIGSDLGVSEKTVKIHRARVMEKMEARSFADLVRMAELVDVRPSGTVS